LKTIAKFDEILGLDLVEHIGYEIPQKILDLAKVRWEYRKSGIFDKADMLRRKIEEQGFTVEDGKGTYKVRRA